MPNCSATARWMASMVILRTWVSMNCLRHCWVTARVISTPCRPHQAMRRTSAPSSSRTLVRTFEAMKRATSVGSWRVLALGLLLQDGDLGLEVRRLDVGDQAPLEAASAGGLRSLGQLFGRAVAGDDDLLHALVQGVEGVEELLLGALLAGEELDVVDEQHVHVAEAVAEAGHLVVADGVDHLVGELLAGDVADGGVRLAALHVVADGVHQVGLAHADAAVEEERVVGLGGALGDGLRGGHGELVAAADDEGVEADSLG